MQDNKKCLALDSAENNEKDIQYEPQRMTLFQKFIDSLNLKERALENKFQINQSLEKEGSSLSLIFNNRKKYIFTNKELSKDVSQDNNYEQTINIKDNRSFSLMNIFQYYYSQTKNNSIMSSNRMDSIYCRNIENFIDLSNHFMIVLGSRIRYTNLKQIIWIQWKTFWSQYDRKSFCYSNCSGSCVDLCKEGKCLYFYPRSELQNPYLPEEERLDNTNFFDDEKYWLSELFSQFIKEEKYKFEDFLFFQLQNMDAIKLLKQKNIENQIAVELKQDGIFQINQLEQLHQIEKQQIIQIRILSLNKQSIPKGEGERQQLYEFILSLPNLNSLKLQLEHSLYHTSEEKYIPQPMNKYSVPVKKNVVINFTKFILQVKVTKLSLLLDEYCYPVSIDLQPILSSLPKMNQRLKVLHISINYRRMYKANEILQNLCQMKQLQQLYLDISNQWQKYHSSQGKIQENFIKWELKLKQKCISLIKLIIQ